MTISPSPAWQRAMQRAIRDGLKPTKCTNGTYRVASTSRPGAVHIVSLDPAGRIIACSDCPGWMQGGRVRPCKHVGAVALALAYISGAHIAPGRYDEPVQAAGGRDRFLRMEVGA